MNVVSSLEFNLAEFELLHCYNALPVKLWQWYALAVVF